MSDYIKLTEPPMLAIQYPKCSACDVELDTDGDGWTCPVCGTAWGMQANDGDKGTLYEDWSGGHLDAEVTPTGEAWRVGHARERARLERYMAEILSKRSGGDQ